MAEQTWGPVAEQLRVEPLRLGVVVTGSRNWRWPLVANRVIRWPDGPVTLLHGGADGADQQMARHAADQGWTVLPPFLPDYDRYDRRVAPLRRNDTMVETLCRMFASGELDVVVCVALWRDHSNGTGYTRDAAIERGVPLVTRFDCACHTIAGQPRETSRDVGTVPGPREPGQGAPGRPEVTEGRTDHQDEP